VTITGAEKTWVELAREARRFVAGESAKRVNPR
jgi:hypothetical protein